MEYIKQIALLYALCSMLNAYFLIPNFHQAEATSRCCHPGLLAVASCHNRREFLPCKLPSSYLHQGTDYVTHHVPEEAIGLDGYDPDEFSSSGDSS